MDIRAVVLSERLRRGRRIARLVSPFVDGARQRTGPMDGARGAVAARGRPGRLFGACDRGRAVGRDTGGFARPSAARLVRIERGDPIGLLFRRWSAAAVDSRETDRRRDARLRARRDAARAAAAGFGARTEATAVAR